MMDDPFEPPFINWHLNEAENGNHESARWLKVNVRAAMRAGAAIDAYALFAVEKGFVKEMTKGGLRNNGMRKGQIGKRGKSELGDHNQLLFAREMWKHLNLMLNSTNIKAQDYVCRMVKSRPQLTPTAAKNAYYRFTKGSDRLILMAELSRDYLSHPETWRKLCPDEQRLELALENAARLRDPAPNAASLP